MKTPKKRTHINVSNKYRPIIEELADNKSKAYTMNTILKDIADGTYDFLEKPEQKKSFRLAVDQELAREARIVAKELGYFTLGELIDEIMESEFMPNIY